jgi:hypothetical protein
LTGARYRKRRGLAKSGRAQVTQQHRQLLMSGTGIENAANVVVSTVGETAVGGPNKRSEIV